MLPTARTPARILVVDDEPILLTVMQRLLQRMGHRVTVAPDGAAALACAADAPFDVIVSDLMMPGMSGVTLAERLATDHPTLRRRLIVMTGGAISAEDEAFLARGDVVVVNKPVGLDELGAAVERALGA